jgi:curved DNA-binding protein CbpA
MDALNQLTAIQKMESKDARSKEFRQLLRNWHPDKNPDKVEVATAVFQFLQKGKRLLGDAGTP